VETPKTRTYDLGDAIVYVCPACGTVNPSGPSSGCPHLQLVRFDGVSEKLEDLILETANARRQYGRQVEILRRAVMTHIQNGNATVETPHRASATDVERLYSSAGATPFSLSSPDASEGARKEKASTRSRSRSTSRSNVDSRQLDLLAYSSPKGNA
jgi:hypothetical protein